ncbi:MAG TPA: adenylyl-sulfate kinase, partial [Candidatus Polarisedimenticolia bacterium]|nr:adenylyl-sulfate kinase [Candidatus Polarisedimenticolia bacterium]
MPAEPVDLLCDAVRARELKREALHLPAWDLEPRQLVDLELLLHGACAPLCGYLDRRDYESVLERMRLAGGELWPLPIVLDLPAAVATPLRPGARLALRHPEGMILALLTVTDLWEPDRRAEAERLFGTADENHPGARALLGGTGPLYAGGPLEGIEPPPHYTFTDLRLTPRQTRDLFNRLGWTSVAAFEPGLAARRAELQRARALGAAHADGLLVQPLTGPSGEAESLEQIALIGACRRELARRPEPPAALALLPSVPRAAGERETLWRALLRRNHGCTHLLLGERDAEGLLRRHRGELGLEVVRLPAGRGPDGWMRRPRRAAPRRRHGFTVFFTGLSGAGKSTIANILVARLQERLDRPITLLDGDLVRRHLSSELGFSRQHRDLNVRRIGFVAGEVTRHRGVAVCAPIAPYRATRREVRDLVAAHGGFVEVYVATPLQVCEARDRKGLY